MVVKEDNRVVKANKTVAPPEAMGQSAGIEKISFDAAVPLFSGFKEMMAREQLHHEYYEEAYERLMKKDVRFYALDLTGLKRAENDTDRDFDAAEKIFV